MKKFFALVLSICMLFSLVACGAQGDSSDGQYMIYLFIASRDEWNTLMESSAQNCGIDGIEISTQNAENDANKQLQQIETAVNAGADGLIVQLADPEIMPEVKELADGTPLVIVNRDPTDTSLFDDHTVFVGGDDFSAGHVQAEFLADYFKAQGKTEITYLLLSGSLGLVSTVRRSEGVLTGLEEAGITATAAVPPLVCDWDRATAVDNVLPLLGTTTFDCIIANNDAMALGGIEALTQEGIDPATVPVIGLDGTSDGCAAVANGTMACTVYNPTSMGGVAAKAVYNIITGADIMTGLDGYFQSDEDPYVIRTAFEMVTKDNVENFR